MSSNNQPIRHESIVDVATPLGSAHRIGDEIAETDRKTGEILLRFIGHGLVGAGQVMERAGLHVADDPQHVPQQSENGLADSRRACELCRKTR